MFGKSRKLSGKTIALMVSLVLLLTVSVGGTLAYLMTTSGPLMNTFKPSEVTTSVDETFSDGKKTNVTIQNTGDTTAWIRAAIVVTWQNAAGEVYGQVPKEGIDYVIDLNAVEGKIEEDKWTEGDDGFYYWPKPVKSDNEDAVNCFTGVLINSCKMEESATAPEGYALTVEIIGSGIQYKPAAAFDAWAETSGLEVNDEDTALILEPESSSGSDD